MRGALNSELHLLDVFMGQQAGDGQAQFRTTDLQNDKEEVEGAREGYLIERLELQQQLLTSQLIRSTPVLIQPRRAQARGPATCDNAE